MNSGIDLYTLSWLLGHSSVAMTQIYAKVTDQKKQEAVDKLPSFGARKGSPA
jgi:site-specific recombinase XerD